MSEKVFKTLLRRRGFYIITEILYGKPEGLSLNKLREELESRKSHYNNYLRVKEMLLKIKLITYFLNSENKKTVKLTKLGRDTWEKMKEIVSEVDEK